MPVFKYGFFLGCNIPAIRPDVEQAIRKTMPKLGVELVDVKGSACCPAFGTYPSADEYAALAINAWNISIAEEIGVDIMVECGSCYSSLKLGRDCLLRDEEKRKKVNEMLKVAGKKFEGKSDVRHIIDVLYNDVGTEKISRSINIKLDGIKVIAHSPCHMLRPSNVLGFDNPERPYMLRELIEALGAEVPRYSREFQCCGGAGGFKRRAHIEAVEYTKKKLDAIKEETDADLIVVSCITCLLHFDEIQKELTEKGKGNYSIPVFDYNQLLALCMGFDPKEVAAISIIPRDEIIERIIKS
ncbi:heterodisulfide reductase [Archaeoglobales archaeon]|nr:MAG: heterodisulfide reductase [Archaeoglobales archaeon]